MRRTRACSFAWFRRELIEIMKTMQIYIHANAKWYKLRESPARRKNQWSFALLFIHRNRMLNSPLPCLKSRKKQVSIEFP